MKRKEAEELSRKYMGEKDCYIHAEMKNGNGLECFAAGGSLALLYGITVIVRRLGILTKCSVEEVLTDIRNMNRDYEKAKGKKGDVYFAERKDFNEMDWEQIRKEEREKAEKDAENKWKSTVANLVEEIELLESTLKGAKANLEKALEAKDRQIKALSKENLVLEHKVDELTQKVRDLLL